MNCSMRPSNLTYFVRKLVLTMGSTSILLMHPLNETAQFAVRELLGGAYCLLYPAIYMQLPLIRELEDFKPLVWFGVQFDWTPDWV
jgi:hypothetical protein